MTSRLDDDYLKGHKDATGAAAWFMLGTAAVFFLIGFSVGGGLGEPPAPVVVERVDTVHSPPVPDFIEVFELQCYWIPKLEESGDADQIGG